MCASISVTGRIVICVRAASALPRNARRRVLAEPLGPRGADLFHGLNQRLPRIPMRRAIATFHDLFVMTGEYSTPEFRARFIAQARDAADRADAVIAVSEFTRSQVVSLLGVDPSRVHVVHHGTRKFEEPLGVPPSREKVILNVGAIQKRKNIARLVEAFETLPSPWQLVLAGSNGYGAEEILARIEKSPARERIRVTGYVSPVRARRLVRARRDFRLPLFGRRLRHAGPGGHGGGRPGDYFEPLCPARSGGGRSAASGPRPTAKRLGQALLDLTLNVDLCRELARRGTARARMFTWENAVRDTWKVYRTISS